MDDSRAIQYIFLPRDGTHQTNKYFQPIYLVLSSTKHGTSIFPSLGQFISNFSSTNLTNPVNMKTALAILYRIDPKKSFQAYIQTCVSLLKTFSNKGLITQGSALHGRLTRMGISSERFIAVKLLIMYLNGRKSAEVGQILKEFGGFDLVVYNCLIAANVQWGNLDEACRVFNEMPVRNGVSWTALISGFMKSGRVEEAIWYFQRNPFQNVVSWTAAISGLVQNCLNYEALMLFLKLLESGVMPNDVTFTSIVRACAEVNAFRMGMSVLGLIVKSGFEHNISVSNSLITLVLRMGEADLARRIFDCMEERDVVSWTAILDVYVEMGDLKAARRIFDEMPERNGISWSAMIARYSQRGYAKEASKLFYQMIQEGFKPNVSCFSCLLSALADLKALQRGSSIHSHVIKIGYETDVFISSSLIDLYFKCGKMEDGRLLFNSILEKNVVLWNAMVNGYGLNGQLEEAEKLFEQIPKRNKVSWNAIIASYVDNERFDKAFEVFYEMLLSGEAPNKSTFSSILCACASLASLEQGKNFHGKTIKLQFQYDLFVGTALIDMYAKSGDIESSMRVFNKMPKKNEISWTAMIQGLAENGFAEQSIMLFEEMERTSSVVPNEWMLWAVLFACSHCGFIDKGLSYFNSMERVYGVKPNGRHYTCMVDLLSRSGCLSEAEGFIKTMPFQPEVNAWAALLSGCRMYNNEEMAERTARKLWDLAEKNSAGYVLLSNIYALAGRWFDVSNIRKLMKEKGLKKSGGCSWIEVKNHVHSFYSEDGTHFLSAEIYGILELLKSEMLV